ncbi:hypothetical protein FHETE_5470 [Fusarium heterosporum]|uniref:Uncharacterized protein n=1 Tax=Fusarium heterosporum TaxID=42747 RepID=A0A8H5TFK8_FUSHE|nr:hypothetical protein FHETE_5470 [Fusarium heterosporum]
MSSSTNKDFTIMHHPDRPSRRITEADIPSDDECKRSFVTMRKASLAEQRYERHDHPLQQQLFAVPEPPRETPMSLEMPKIHVLRTERPQTERPQTERPHIQQPRAQQPSRLTFGPMNGPFRSAFGPLTPAEEEPCPFENIDANDSTATTQDTLQVPETSVEIRSSILIGDELSLARGPSPPPVVISEAKTIRLERVDNLSTPNASPLSSPRPSDASASGWPRRKQSVQMVAIRRSSQDSQKRKPSVHTVVVHRPSKVTVDGLTTHPVRSPTPTQVHIRQDSASDPMCRLCHNGIAEKSGICSSCDNDSMPASPVEISPNFSRLHYKPTVKRYNRPPPLIPQSLDSVAKLHRPSASLTSDPESNQPSPPTSPRSPCSSPAETIQTVTSGPSVPPTPMSALPTPEVLKQFKDEIESRAQADDSPAFDDPWMMKSTSPEADVYEDDWADYYFDEQNFNPGQGQRVMDGPLIKVQAASPSPVCPGPGWI